MNHNQIENMIKAFAVVVSQDRTRLSLTMAHVEKTSDHTVSIVATDGHLVLVRNEIEWSWLVDFYRIQHSSILPEEPCDGALNVCPKQKRKNKMPYFFTEDEHESMNYLPYPKWQNVIPSSFENKFINFPSFGSDVITKAGKVFQLTTMNNKAVWRGPDYWNGHLGLTITILNGYHGFLGIMPTKKSFVHDLEKPVIENFNPLDCNKSFEGYQKPEDAYENRERQINDEKMIIHNEIKNTFERV